MPNPGPYAGQFLVEQLAAGNFNLTAGDRAVAGTGSLMHDEGTITVSISGIVNEREISGTVSNALLGNGDFTGQFLGASTCAGTFTFTDTLGSATTTGTWSANLPQ